MQLQTLLWLTSQSRSRTVAGWFAIAFLGVASEEELLDFLAVLDQLSSLYFAICLVSWATPGFTGRRPGSWSASMSNVLVLPMDFANWIGMAQHKYRWSCTTWAMIAQTTLFTYVRIVYESDHASNQSKLVHNWLYTMGSAQRAKHGRSASDKTRACPTAQFRWTSNMHLLTCTSPRAPDLSPKFLQVSSPKCFPAMTWGGMEASLHP